MALPLRSFLTYLARRGTRSAADLAAQRELAAGARATVLPRGLEIEWLGCSGFRLRAEGPTLLVAPYVSRVPLRSVLARRSAPGDPAAVARYVDRADAVLIGHAHFDHAMGAPHIARATGAAVYGSRSTANLMALQGGPLPGLSSGSSPALAPWSPPSPSTPCSGPPTAGPGPPDQ